MDFAWMSVYIIKVPFQAHLLKMVNQFRIIPFCCFLWWEMWWNIRVLPSSVFSLRAYLEFDWSILSSRSPLHCRIVRILASLVHLLDFRNIS